MVIIDINTVIGYFEIVDIEHNTAMLGKALTIIYHVVASIETLDSGKLQKNMFQQYSHCKAFRKLLI